MALTGSMSAAITGLKAHMDALNVVGNNVANVNTYGYKAGRVTFRESIYSTQSAGAAGTTATGGTNPRQIGYGTSVGTIDLDMSTSNMEPTGIDRDAGIQGDGFFLVGDKAGVDLDNLDSLLLTRVGDFRIDANGYLTDGAGNIVYGFAACTGAEDPGLAGDDATISTQLVPLRLPLAAKGTDDEGFGANVGDAIFPGLVEEGDGSVNSYGDDIDVNSYNCITYTGLSIDANGKVTCNNGKTGDPVTIGYVALGTVTNPGGLTHTEGPYYQAKEGAGQLSICTAGGALEGRYLNNITDPDAATEELLLGKGSSLLPGFLEASGTDLAQEFSNMIVYQRGYQANTRIVTVTDTMLEELVNMKR